MCLCELCPQKWGPQRKDFGGRFGFPGFYRVFASTTGLEGFSEKFSKQFSFGGGSVRFCLLCVIKSSQEVRFSCVALAKTSRFLRISGS